MTVINVYDMSFNLIGVVDDFESIIWRPSYYAVGDFEIYLPATKAAVELLQKDRIVVRNTDVFLEKDGNVTFKNAMIIKNIDLATDVENGDYLTVTGRELKYLLHQRIIWTQTTLSGTVEAGIRQIINDNAISPTDSNRAIPNLVLGAEAGLTDTIEKQLTGDYLDEAIEEICTAYNYGWDIYGYNSSYVFILYQGLDRSYDQSERPYVVFSDAFENLFNTDYQLQTEEYANTALVGGEGEGAERTYTTVNNTNSGLNRFELFVDAKDISSKDENDKTIAADQYLLLLQERGTEKLAEQALTEGFSGELLSSSGTNFEYGTDFDLGDLVTVINSYGISKKVRVLSAIESEDVDGKTLIPQFNF